MGRVFGENERLHNDSSDAAGDQLQRRDQEKRSQQQNTWVELLQLLRRQGEIEISRAVIVIA